MSETEGIVLSPQRRSFITGCQVSKDTSSSTNSNTTNTSSVLKDLKETANDKSSNNSESLRPDTIAGSRRVGSGRIRPSQAPNEEFDRERGGERADHRDRIPKLVDTFGQYCNQYQNLISKENLVINSMGYFFNLKRAP